MAENNSGLFWKSAYSEALVPDLSPVEKQLRDLFVNEYLFDYDKVEACIRIGFSSALAPRYADEFLKEPYTLQRIKLMQEAKDEDHRTQEDIYKQEVLVTLRKALKIGPLQTRVAAASRMATILGMDAPKKTSDKNSVRGGVMVIPSSQSLDDWENAAMESQLKLVQDTRNESA